MMDTDGRSLAGYGSDADVPSTAYEAITPEMVDARLLEATATKRVDRVVGRSKGEDAGAKRRIMSKVARDPDSPSAQRDLGRIAQSGADRNNLANEEDRRHLEEDEEGP
ncbi:hypothetical protein Misp01_48260 [Microtetraspora sp. NBRC 13810]|nr:hypothetical protein Misp01_48260 [Microtetraspora sp. NBRC 13810]